MCDIMIAHHWIKGISHLIKREFFIVQILFGVVFLRIFLSILIYQVFKYDVVFCFGIGDITQMRHQQIVVIERNL